VRRNDSPRTTDRLRDANSRQFQVEEAALPSFTSVAARSSPRSRSTLSPLWGIGIAAEGDSFRVCTASACTSSGSEKCRAEETSVVELAFEVDAMERTTSPLQIGHVRRRVVNHGVLNMLAKGFCLGDSTYMHSAWNSWPQGKLITRLWPSTYSSKHTTHSICRPLYFFGRSRFRSPLASDTLAVALSREDDTSSASIEVVRDRGRFRLSIVREFVRKSGDVGDDASGEVV
jgi:hypothetical protein